MGAEDRQEVDFLASIYLSRDDLEETDGDVAQAVQNRIGHTGAQVIEVQDEDLL